MSPTLTWTCRLAPVPPPCRPPSAPPRPRIPLDAVRPTRNARAEPADGRAIALVEAMARPLAEVLTGARATGQLARWIGPASLDRLSAAVRVGRWRRVVIRSVHATSHPDTGIWGRIGFDCDGQPVTGSLHLSCHAGRWRCTNLDLLLQGSHLRVDQDDSAA